MTASEKRDLKIFIITNNMRLSTAALIEAGAAKFSCAPSVVRDTIACLLVVR